VGAPPEAVYRLVADLAQYARYAPTNLRCGRALTSYTDEPGARIELRLRLVGPLWQHRVLQLHALEPPCCAIVGPPDASAFLTRWTLAAEPPGTVVTISTDLGPPGGLLAPAAPLIAWRLTALARRTQGDVLARLKQVAEQDLPARRS
jgi:hypothetical protein